MNKTYDLVNYELVDVEKLEKCGFKSFSRCYFKRDMLYKNLIALCISISKPKEDDSEEGNTVIIDVVDDLLGQPYAAFYHQDENKNNEVLKKVNKKYSQIMNNLVTNGALKVHKRK